MNLLPTRMKEGKTSFNLFCSHVCGNVIIESVRLEQNVMFIVTFMQDSEPTRTSQLELLEQKFNK